MDGWKEIGGCAGYWVSRDGQVRSRFRVLKPALGNHGYWQATCRIGHRRYRAFLIHRLVAAAFVSNPLGKTQVNHKNADRSDNRADNLEWVSPLENSGHAISAGLMAVGEMQPTSKLSNWDAWRIPQWVAGGLSDSEIAKILGVRRETVGNVRRGYTWTHITGLGRHRAPAAVAAYQPV